MNDKIRWDLLPIIPMEEAARVMTANVEKHGDSGAWVNLPLEAHYAAMMRHLVEWKKGNDCGDRDTKKDRESGLHHMAHIICRACFIFELDREAVRLAPQWPLSGAVAKKLPRKVDTVALKRMQQAEEDDAEALLDS